jgi:hypothetical protein
MVVFSYDEYVVYVCVLCEHVCKYACLCVCVCVCAFLKMGGSVWQLADKLHQEWQEKRVSLTQFYQRVRPCVCWCVGVWCACVSVCLCVRVCFCARERESECNVNGSFVSTSEM